MKLVSMERTEAEKKAAEKRMEAMPNTGPDYPWGLSINLGKDELAKLGITDLPEVGELIRVTAVTKVTRVSRSASESQDDDSMSVELQITEMACELEDATGDQTGAFAKAAKKLYP